MDKKEKENIDIEDLLGEIEAEKNLQMANMCLSEKISIKYSNIKNRIYDYLFARNVGEHYDKMRKWDLENMNDVCMNASILKEDASEKFYKRICAKIPNLVTASSLTLTYFTETPAYLLLAIVGEAGRMTTRSYFDHIVAKDYEELTELSVDKAQNEEIAKSIKPEDGNKWEDSD